MGRGLGDRQRALLNVIYDRTHGDDDAWIPSAALLGMPDNPPPDEDFDAGFIQVGLIVARDPRWRSNAEANRRAMRTLAARLLIQMETWRPYMLNDQYPHSRMRFSQWVRIAPAGAFYIEVRRG